MSEPTDQKGEWVDCETCRGTGILRIMYPDNFSFRSALCKRCAGEGKYFVPATPPI
jgi:DnaJ-class molecular chaperone